MGLKERVTAAKLTDDLVVDILSRLPYKFFCRYKCVCKAWSAFSSDPYYCKKLPKKITTGLLYQSDDNSAIPLISLSQNDGEIDGILADVPHHEHLEFLDCCNGLVLCKYKSSYTSSTCRFVVCNPATREWRVLPDTHAERADPHYRSIVAYDPSHSPHFYVFNFHLNHDHNFIRGTSKLEIFSSRGSAWLVDDSWNSDIIISRRPSHVFLQGLLYVGTDRHEVVVFKGFEAMSDGTPPNFGFIEFPLDTSLVRKFTSGCFAKSSGTLHYTLPDTSGSIIVWDLDDRAPDMWTVNYYLSMTPSFGRDDLAYYDDDDGDDDNLFWNCDYRIVALDVEKDFVFLFDTTMNKLLLYNIFSGKLNELSDGFQHLRDQYCYCYYVPCYSELPSQELPV